MAARRFTSGKANSPMIRTYAPVSKAKFVREMVGTKEYLPNPAKRPRTEHYYEAYEARKQPIKHVYKAADTKPVNPVQTVKVIEKKPALYAPSNTERKEIPPPRPQRVKAPRKPDPTPEIRSSDATTKHVEKTNKQETVENAPSAKVPDKESKNVLTSAPEKPIAESNEEESCELPNLMASILQEELEQIMIEVWQGLPDDPPTEAEELVANKFRNEAGDDLQNAMGLNVTARLLNVHNPLYAKLQFSGKPEAGCLQAFISEYKISAFKRIADSSRDLFAARFDRIADFDRLCVHSEVKCGSATVTIIPCYKYFSSPPALKSIYADNNVKTKKLISTEGPHKPSYIDKMEETGKNTETDTYSANNVEEKIIVKDTVAKTPNTPTRTATATNAKVATKAVVDKAAAQVKPKRVAKEPSQDIPLVTKKVTPIKIENKADKTNNTGNNGNDKQVKTDIIDGMMVVDEMGEGDDDEMGEDDDEEMTDQDILALMSGGIVLDECSGSDDDK